jgi:hypothetical protein
MFMLLIKVEIGDGDHEPAYPSFYESLDAIKEDADEINEFLEERAGEDQLEDVEEYKGLHLSVIEVEMGFNDRDMMRVFWDPTTDCVKRRRTWESLYDYVFAGYMAEFREWVKNPHVQDRTPPVDLVRDVLRRHHPKKLYSNCTHAYMQLIKQLGITDAPKFTMNNTTDVNMATARLMYEASGKKYRDEWNAFIATVDALRAQGLSDGEISDKFDKDGK